MTEDSDVVVVNVPVCFISNHEGFRGSIKTFTEDFVVTEINVDGQLVTQAAVTPHEPATPGQRSDVKQDGPTDVSADCDVTTPSPVTSDLDLDLILGPSATEELEQFAVSLKDASGLDVKTPPGRELLHLGSFPDKHRRARVHRAVRSRFPFLMTVTSQTDISVKEDPDYRQLSRLVSQEEAGGFFRFIDAKAPGSSWRFRADQDKQNRTAVHHFLSRRFGKLVETKSFSDQEGTVIWVRLRERGRPRKRKAEHWREEEEVYTAFTLCKRNLETLEAISYMAAALDVLPSHFTYAGIKDKRAVTYQSMVVKKVSPQRLKEKTSEFEKRGIHLSHVRSVREPLRLGRLQGNHFDLVVRDVRPDRTTDTPPSGPDTDPAALVQQAVENVKAKGFVNYYGPQRFGSAQSVQSDRVGLDLLREDLVSAVRLFFTPDDGDDPQNQAKRHFLQTNNAKESLALMPMSKARERLMLRALHRYGTGLDGCTQAWLSLPHGMRVFYPHAYCSRVWNEAAAYRLSTLGHIVRTGDLVWTQGGQNLEEDTGESSSLPQIHVVTEQEEQDGVYTLGQVLLPMPGNTVKYPENKMASWYQQRLARDGLETCRFRVSSLKLNLPGCYRPLLAAPRNLSYHIPCVRAGEGGGGGGGGGGRGEGGSERQLNDAAASDSLTLTVNFDLDASCYATVCLREMMKSDP